MTFRGVDAVEAAGADFVVCGRVADLPPISSLPKAVQSDAAASRRDSTRMPCEGCGETILRGPLAPPGVPAICTHCHKDVRAIAARAAAKASGRSS